MARNSSRKHNARLKFESLARRAVQKLKRVVLIAKPPITAGILLPFALLAYTPTSAISHELPPSTEEEERPVDRDKYDVLGPIYAAIGEEAVAIVEGPWKSLYLYAEAEEGCSGDGIFVDEGEVVRYYRPSADLLDLILEAWETEGSGEKWELMEYEIKGTSFDANLIYPDEIDHNLSISELREGFLQRRFGDKPVIYPPLPEGLE